MTTMICRYAAVWMVAVWGAVLLTAPVSAAPIVWTDWTSADATSAAGTAGGVTVTFSGLINPAAQTAGGTNYWAVNSSIYTSVPEVDNPPPDSDIIRLTGGTGAGTQTLTFSQPVVDPVMAIMSLGQTSVEVRYEFDAPFDVLNSGPGFFGGGILNELAGNVLQGFEGHGLIQFSGTFSSISWDIPLPEFWHGFQVGFAAQVPEPMSIWLLAVGLIGLGSMLGRKARS